MKTTLVNTGNDTSKNEINVTIHEQGIVKFI